MSYFELNGHACLLPGQLYSEFTKLGIDCSDWYGLANEFVDQRGVDPSYGHLLCQSDSVNAPAEDNKLKIQDDNGNEVKFSVKIEWARKIGQAAAANLGYYLVRVVDDRYALANELLGKRFNRVLNYLPAIPKGTFTYHPDSLNKVSETLKVPYTWEKLFDECWKIPSGAKLEKDNITFPVETPQPPDWRYTTRRDALEMLLQWMNLTIIYDKTNDKWSLKEVEGPGNFFVYDSFLCRNNFTKYKEPGEVVPSKVKLYFPKLDQSENDITEYQVIDKTPATNPKNKQELHLALPYYYVPTFDSPNLPQELGNAFIKKADDRWKQFPPQEKTFRGIHFLHPSSTLEKVIYYSYDATPFTYIESTSKREWLIVPKNQPADMLYMAFGTIKNDVTAEQPYFQVNLKDIEVGRVIPDDKVEVTCKNDHKKAYKQGETIAIWQKADSLYWRTNNGGGTTSKGVVRFELAEDKDLVDFARLAYLLDDAGYRIKELDGITDVTVYVGDAWQQYQGYKEYTDPLYGEQRGFRGFANPLLDEFLQGKPLYEIIEMEHVCRYAEARIPNELDYGVNPPSYTGGVGKAVLGFNYWDGRTPKTTKQGEDTSQSNVHYTVDFIDRQQFYESLPPGSKLKLIWDETAKIFTLWHAKLSTKQDIYGLLIRPVAKAELIGIEEIKPGYTKQCVLRAKVETTEDEPETKIKLGNKCDAVNPIWLDDDIHAGDGTQEYPGLPVIVVGYMDKYKTYDTEDGNEAFWIKNVIYPVTIVQARTNMTVSGGPFSATVIKKLWGRTPKETTINNIANPDGWDGNNGAYCLIIRLPDGSWQAIDLACKEG